MGLNFVKLLTILLLASLYKTKKVTASDIIVTNNHHCTQIGKALFEKRATIEQTYVAVSLCEGLVHPMDSGLGGGFQALIHNAKQAKKGETRHVYLMSREYSPMNKSFRTLPFIFGNSVGVPAVLAGYARLLGVNQCIYATTKKRKSRSAKKTTDAAVALHRREHQSSISSEILAKRSSSKYSYNKDCVNKIVSGERGSGFIPTLRGIPYKEIFEPVIKLASSGFNVSTTLGSILNESTHLPFFIKKLNNDKSTNYRLAVFLQHLSFNPLRLLDAYVKWDNREIHPLHDIRAIMLNDVRNHGSLLTSRDFRAYRAEVRSPLIVKLTLRGVEYELVTIPSPGGGECIAFFAKLVEGLMSYNAHKTFNPVQKSMAFLVLSKYTYAVKAYFRQMTSAQKRQVLLVETKRIARELYHDIKMRSSESSLVDYWLHSIESIPHKFGHTEFPIIKVAMPGERTRSDASGGNEGEETDKLALKTLTEEDVEADADTETQEALNERDPCIRDTNNCTRNPDPPLEQLDFYQETKEELSLLKELSKELAVTNDSRSPTKANESSRDNEKNETRSKIRTVESMNEARSKIRNDEKIEPSVKIRSKNRTRFAGKLEESYVDLTLALHNIDKVEQTSDPNHFANNPRDTEFDLDDLELKRKNSKKTKQAKTTENKTKEETSIKTKRELPEKSKTKTYETTHLQYENNTTHPLPENNNTENKKKEPSTKTKLELTENYKTRTYDTTTQHLSEIQEDKQSNVTQVTEIMSSSEIEENSANQTSVAHGGGLSAEEPNSTTIATEIKISDEDKTDTIDNFLATQSSDFFRTIRNNSKTIDSEFDLEDLELNSGIEESSHETEDRIEITNEEVEDEEAEDEEVEDEEVEDKEDEIVEDTTEDRPKVTTEHSFEKTSEYTSEQTSEYRPADEAKLDFVDSVKKIETLSRNDGFLRDRFLRKRFLRGTDDEGYLNSPWGTTNVVVKSGNRSIIATSSINHSFGSLIFSQHLGIPYNNVLRDFTPYTWYQVNPRSSRTTRKVKSTSRKYVPTQPPKRIKSGILLFPNRALPHSIPQSNMGCTFLSNKITKNPVFGIGAAGGFKITSAIINTMWNYLFLGDSLEKSISRLRITTKLNYKTRSTEVWYEFPSESQYQKDLLEQYGLLYTGPSYKELMFAPENSTTKTFGRIAHTPHFFYKYREELQVKYIAEAGYSAATAFATMRDLKPRGVSDPRRGGSTYVKY